MAQSPQPGDTKPEPPRPETAAQCPTSARTLPSSPSARPTKNATAGRFHPIPRGFPYGVQSALPGMRVTALAYRHGDQRHRRTNEMPEKRNSTGRIGLLRNGYISAPTAESRYKPPTTPPAPAQCFQSAMNGRQQAQDLLHDPSFGNQRCCRASKSCSKIFAATAPAPPCKAETASPPSTSPGKTVVEHQLPEGPRSCQVEARINRPRITAPGPTISVVRSTYCLHRLPEGRSDVTARPVSQTGRNTNQKQVDGNRPVPHRDSK